MSGCCQCVPCVTMGRMRAAVCTFQNAENPLAGLELRDVPEPDVRPGWVDVKVAAASVNMHDLWTLKGVGHPKEMLPRILGCDGVAEDADGRRYLIYPVVADADRGFGDETLDPKRSLLSEAYEGTFAERIAVPERNLVPIPDGFGLEEAAALPIAWGTAYRMLATQGCVKAGDRVLVQGAGGGVNSAAIRLAVAMGVRVYATSRTDDKLAAAESWGAIGVKTGERLPEQVDVVIETVGEATWDHSLKSLRPGGAIVVAGATSGFNPPADLARVFYQQKRILGSTCCTLAEFKQLVRMLEVTGARPVIDSTYALDDIHSAFSRMEQGDVTGKLIIKTP